MAKFAIRPKIEIETCSRVKAGVRACKGKVRSGLLKPLFKNQIDGRTGGNGLYPRFLEALASRVRVTPLGFYPVTKATG